MRDVVERTGKATRLWDAEHEFSVFEDALYERLGGDAVEPFDYLGHDHYDRSLEIYGMKPSVELSDDDRTFIKREGFTKIYHDRKGSPERCTLKERRHYAATIQSLRDQNADLERRLVVARADEFHGELRDKLEQWAFNVMLECSGNAAPIELAVGGAVLDLHDLQRILEAAPALASEPVERGE